MAHTSDGSCLNCQFAEYPAEYSPSRRYAALAVAVFDVCVVIGGLLFVWLRRHTPIISRRDWWLSIGLAISNAMWLVVPYREFFNESNVPCPAYYAVGTINTSIMPAIVAVRWVGLFVQHVRQARISAAHAAALAFHASGSGDFSGNRSDLYEPVRDASGAPTTPVPILSMGSDVGLKVTPDEANGGRMRTRTGSLDGHSMRSLALPQSFSSSTKDNAFFEWLDGVVVWLRLDLLRMQVALIALLSLPHFLFYFVRLSWHPDYYDPSRVGCMNDAMENAMCIIAPAIIIVFVVPIVIRLRNAPDTLGFRQELLVQLVTLPPLFSFWIAGEYLDFETSIHINGEYGVTIWLDIVSITSLWVPAILSLSISAQDAPEASSTRLLASSRWCTCGSRRASLVAPHPLIRLDSADGADHSLQGSSIPSRGTPVAAPADLDEEQPDSDRRPKVERGRPRDYATILAASIVRRDIISPPPTGPELLAVMMLPPGGVLLDARALTVVTAVLVCSRRGIAMLRRILEREFCVENAAFATDAFVLREMTIGAEAAVLAIESTTQSSSPRPDGSLATLAPPPAVVAGASQGSSEAGTEGTKPRGHRASRRRSTGAHADAGACLGRMRSLLDLYVTPAAEARVNLSNRNAKALSSAMAELGKSIDETAVAGRVDALHSVQAALTTAEAEVFGLLKHGPVFRFVQSEEYKTWASAVVTSLRGVANRRTPAAVSEAAPSPADAGGIAQ